MPFEITTEADLAAIPSPFGRHAPIRGSLITKRLCDIKAKPVSWLWPGRIARGKLTIIAGNPGLGKSQITASIAGVVTTGGRWPVHRDQCERGDMLFLTAEDDAADTLRPRLEAAAADLGRVHVIEGVIAEHTGIGEQPSRAFSLQEDLRALAAKLDELGNVAAVVIDPISAYLGEADSHKNAEVRAMLTPLSDLAARSNVAVIGISHLTKAAGAQAIMRVSGSLAFVAAARAAWLVASDPNDNTRRLFLPLKNNLGPDASGFAYCIEGATIESAYGPIETSRIVWESGVVKLTADEVTRADTPQRMSALNEATEWLENALAGGPVPQKQLFESGGKEGFSEKTLRRAKSKLGVKSAKSEFEGGWAWSLLPKMASSSEGGQ